MHYSQLSPTERRAIAWSLGLRPADMPGRAVRDLVGDRRAWGASRRAGHEPKHSNGREQR